MKCDAFMRRVVAVGLLCVGCGQPTTEQPATSAAVETEVVQSPTPQSVIDQLDALGPDRWPNNYDRHGARYWTNEHGQVYYVILKCLPLSDDDLAFLSDLPHLERLSLRGITHHKGTITNETIRRVAKLPKLERLDISANSSVDNESINILTEAKNLRRLDIHSTSVTADAVPDLSKLPLTFLRLQQNGGRSIVFNEHTAPYFAKMPLRHIEGLASPAGSVKYLSQMKHLTALPSSFRSQVADTDLEFIGHLKEIDRLELTLSEGWSNLSRLRHLSALPNLKFLILRVPQEFESQSVDTEGMRHLRDVPTLRAIYPGRVTDQLATAISEVEQLQHVVLRDESPLTVEGLANLCSMPNLAKLQIPRGLVNDTTIEMASSVKSLESLSLGVSDRYFLGKYGVGTWRFDDPPAALTFSEDSLLLLRKLPNLKRLDLNDWAVTDVSLKHISRLTQLRTLGLANTNISDAGLKHLEPLTRVTLISIEKTNTTYNAAAALAEHINPCSIWNETRWGNPLENAGMWGPDDEHLDLGF